MHLVAVILGVLLLPKALSALKCYECIPEGTTGNCTEIQRYCPAYQQCGATTAKSVILGVIHTGHAAKSCMPSDQCDSGSMDLGFSKTGAVSKCCSTDLCNVQYPTLPASSPSSPNGKRCYTCDIYDTSDTCSTKLSCSGDEDRCIKMRVEFHGLPKTMKGCASKSLCASSDAATQVMPLATEASCCEGDLCNSAISTAVSLLLLAATVVSVALFN